MAARIYGRKVHDCGCQTSYDNGGRLMGFGMECKIASGLFTSLIQNPRRNGRELTSEQISLREHVGVDPVTGVRL